MDLLARFKLKPFSIALLVFFFYTLLGLLSLELHSSVSPAPVIWLPAGVATVAVVLFGAIALVPVTAGAMVIVLSQLPALDQGTNVVAITLQVMAGPLQATMVWLLYRSASLKPVIHDAADLVRFMVVTTAFTSLFGAVSGATSFWLHGWISAEEIPSAAVAWWSADALGILLIAPLIMSHRAAWYLPAKRKFELLLCLLGSSLVVCGFYVLPTLTTVSLESQVLAEATMLFVLWSAFRFEVPGVAMTSAAIMLCTLLGEQLATPVFPSNVYLDLLVGTNLVIGYILAMVIRQHQLSNRLALKHEEELSRKSRAMVIGELSASINHQLATPLQAATMSLERLRSELSAVSGISPKADRSLALAEASVNKVSEIHSGLADLLRGGGRAATEFCVNSAVRANLESLSHRVEEASVKVEFQFAANLRKVYCIKEALDEVIINLSVNAIEALSVVTDRTPLLTIKTRMTQENKLSLAFQDNGSGISDEAAQMIFEPFWTAKTSGTGLGLSVSRSLVENMGGLLSLQSNPEGGCIFTVLLPVASNTHEEQSVLG